MVRGHARIRGALIGTLLAGLVAVQVTGTGVAAAPPAQAPLGAECAASEPGPGAVAAEAIDAARVERVGAILAELPGPAAAVFEDLGGPGRAERDGSATMPAASTIKLPLMIEAYRQAGEGRLDLGQVQSLSRADVVGGTGVLAPYLERNGSAALSTHQLLTLLLLHSDNAAGNVLVGLLGQGVPDDGLRSISATMQALGFGGTAMQRVFLDLAALRAGRENVTTAADLAAMLRQIRRGELLSPWASGEMLSLLRCRGERTEAHLDYLGRYLQPRPLIAHLNGTFGGLGIRNDAGLIEADGRAFGLTILLRDQADEPGAEEAIGRAAQRVLAAVTTAP